MDIFGKALDLWFRFYERMTAKSASLLSLTFGIINVIWIYYFDRLSDGVLRISGKISIEQWVFIANLTLYALIVLLLLSILFGIIGIKKALSSKRYWIIVSIIGILLGVLPLIICKMLGKTWFRLLFF